MVQSNVMLNIRGEILSNKARAIEVNSLVGFSEWNDHTILHFIYFLYLFIELHSIIITYKLLQYVLVSVATWCGSKTWNNHTKCHLGACSSRRRRVADASRTNNKCSCPFIFFSFSSVVLTPPFIPTLKMRRDCVFMRSFNTYYILLNCAL